MGLSKDQVIFNLIDIGDFEKAEKLLKANPEVPQRDDLLDLLNFEINERKIVEEKKVREKEEKETWNNIPFKKESFIRASSFEKAIKKYKDPKLRKRIENSIEKILLRQDDPLYHKKIKAQPGYYAARVTENYRIKFRINQDNKIELVDFGTHEEILSE